MFTQVNVEVTINENGEPELAPPSSSCLLRMQGLKALGQHAHERGER